MKDGVCQRSSHTNFSNRSGWELCLFVFPAGPLSMICSCASLKVMRPPSFGSFREMSPCELSARTLLEISFQELLLKCTHTYHNSCCKFVSFGRGSSIFGKMSCAQTWQREDNNYSVTRAQLPTFHMQIWRSSFHPELLIL